MEEGFVLMSLCKYKKVESVITQNDHETTSKKWTDKKKTDLLFVLLFGILIVWFRGK